MITGANVQLKWREIPIDMVSRKVAYLFEGKLVKRRVSFICSGVRRFSCMFDRRS